MTFDMDWSHSFCLMCDRQTDGNVYCSETCRLAEYEDVSNASSIASSPTSPQMKFLSRKSTQLSRSSATQLHDSYQNSNSDHSHPSSLSIASSVSDLQLSPTAKTIKIGLISLNPNSEYSLRGSQPNTVSETSLVSENSQRELRVYANAFNRSKYSRRQTGY
ncbi:hypothetical protein GcM3_065014 [Golovinomyces cichoracearum]|uniref:Life-span regulatory factor domain-containing protein n=1 Tax=Golovinomyces cichoracearum TaxID=62708 RepID=A0A420IV14_9PEZI|nr:hypothetical protein GcM3_065014 [Golovinomyces cichoracearum]